ncbi:MAG: oxidoreductase [Bryobacteraceae bacterium]
MDRLSSSSLDVANAARPRLATVWLGGCSGCHMSFLDLDERLIDLAGIADLCYSPIMDVKEFPDRVDVTLVEGAVANEDHLRTIRLIRRRTRILVAFGDCAVTGNVTALRNLFSVEDVLNRAYRESAIVVGVPTGNDIVPRLLDRVLRIHDVVPVDHFLPGCPPSADAIFAFVSDLLAGRAPAVEGRKFGS